MNDFMFWTIVIASSVIGLCLLIYLIIMLTKKRKPNVEIEVGSQELDLTSLEEVGKTIKENKTAKKAADTKKVKEEVEEIEAATKDTFDLTPRKPNLKWYQWIKKRNYKKELSLSDTSVIIIFETNNAKFKMWLQVEKEEGFKYRGKKYVFDISQRVHFPEINKYGYFFQESLDIPISKNIKVNSEIYKLIDKLQRDMDGYFSKPIDKHINPVKIREAIDSSGLTEIETAIEPKSLMRFIDTQVILQVMGGAWFTKVMKIVLILCLVLLVIGVIIIGITGYIGWETYQMGKA